MGAKYCVQWSGCRLSKIWTGGVDFIKRSERQRSSCVTLWTTKWGGNLDNKMAVAIRSIQWLWRYGPQSGCGNTECKVAVAIWTTEWLWQYGV